ncbi:pilus assembly FimT family protein [Salinithrix halophila]|uniref:Tfp pilus assembly protein FimT/FimU n=1 Tax=Salinithrix halophila TaxID=1485204 RepID=A0ABV8JCG7_9BACL
MEGPRETGTKTLLKKRSVPAVSSCQGGFTYVELAVVMAVLVILIPVIFSLEYVMEKELKKGFYRHQLQAEVAQFTADVRNEVRRGRRFRLSSEGWLLFDLPSGDTVRYKQYRRRLIRSIRPSSERKFRGTTIVLQNVYFSGFEPDREGVWVETRLQNWHSDLSIRRYFRGRVSP